MYLFCFFFFFVPFPTVCSFYRIIPTYRKTISEVIEGVKNTHLIYKTLMDKRGEEVDERDDLMAVFMKEIARRRRDRDTAGGHFFTEKQCCFLLSDLFGAGVETSANTLRWFLLYMAINKGIQVTRHVFFIIYLF